MTDISTVCPNPQQLIADEVLLKTDVTIPTHNIYFMTNCIEGTIKAEANLGQFSNKHT